MSVAEGMDVHRQANVRKWTVQTVEQKLTEAVASVDTNFVAQWLKFLSPADANLVCARARRMPWKVICWQCGISRATAYRRWKQALERIALQLAHRLPIER